MDHTEKIEKIEAAIFELEDLKEIIKDESNHRMKFFMEMCFNSVLGEKIPYTLKCRLMDLYSEYTKQVSGSDEWYALSFKGQKEFDRVINEIKLWTGDEDDNTEKDAIYKRAKFKTVWGGNGISITVDCVVNTDTHEIMDIPDVDVQGVNSLDTEFVIIDGKCYEAFCSTNYDENDKPEIYWWYR